MTDRKPDIITKWSIKENADNTYTAKCSTMPNVELTAENVVTILGKIEGYLKTMYRDTTVDGGITGINAEYNVTKRQEMSLDTFDTNDTEDTEMPTGYCPNFDLIPEEERIKGFCGEAYGGYVWKPIKALVSGCALCEQLRSGECKGNKDGDVCTNFKCRNDAGSNQCAECKHFTRSVGTNGCCDAHDDAEVGMNDYSCNLFKGRTI